MAPCPTEMNQLGVRALCTNRHLPVQMAKGVSTTDCMLDNISAPVTAIRMIQGPTIPRPSLVLAGQNPEKPQVASGRFAWRLVSHLSLNYLSLSDAGTETGAEGLREMLKLYADPSDRETLKQIDGLRSVKYEPVVSRVEIPGPITFARGLRITVLFDESAFQGQGVFVLGSVLEQFFTKYVSLNSFTETVIATQQRKEIMRWPIQMGKRQIL
jgi:type VI secretion system protein ImpG